MRPLLQVRRIFRGLRAEGTAGCLAWEATGRSGSCGRPVVLNAPCTHIQITWIGDLKKKAGGSVAAFYTYTESLGAGLR